MGFHLLYETILEKWTTAGLSGTEIHLLTGADIPDQYRLPMMLEAIGIQKLFGHPILDPVEGLAELKARGTRDLPCDPGIVSRGVAMLKYELCKNYFN